MKLSSFYPLAIGAGILLAGAPIGANAQSQQLTNDPPSYFGGANHQAYLDWMTDNDIAVKYNSSVYMPARGESMGSAVHWNVDDEYFYVAIAARATGWVGFGLSEAGGMFGSDMALFTASRPNEIVDAHVVLEPFPEPDDCQQDWELISSHSTSTGTTTQARQAVDTTVEDQAFLMFEARRKLDTEDPQDIALIRDSLVAIPEQRIIAAWGNTPEVSYHGVNDVARGSIRIYQSEAEEPNFDLLMARDSDGSFFLGANNFEIPTNETTYEDFCITRQDLIAQGVPDTTDMMSVIGFRPIVDDGPSARFVHHYVVTGHFNASDNACAIEEGGMDMVYVWAPGDGPFALPDFLGGALFGEDGFQGFSVEIHYDNPNFQEGVIDSSGVEIYYSTTPREIEVAVLQVGDPFVSLFSQPVGEGYNLHQFDCPGSCSELFLQDNEPVTVIREYLHMHATGSRMTNEHIRDGEVIRTAASEVWDFDANGNVPTKQEPYELRPGDGFRTKCYFDGESDTVFGLGSREEMCMAFLYYYPRKSISVPTPNGNFSIPFICGNGIDFFDGACEAPHSGGVLESEASLNREFGKKKSQCLLDSDAGATQIDMGASPAPAPLDELTPVAPGDWPEPTEPEPAPAPMDGPAPASLDEQNSSISSALSPFTTSSMIMVLSAFGIIVAEIIA